MSDGRCAGAVALALSSAVWLASGEAAAQPAPAPPAPYRSPLANIDPALPIGIVSSGVGVALLVAGGAVYATSPPDREVERGGVVRVYRSEHLQDGVAMLGAGGGLVLAGAPALLFGLFGPRKHMSKGRMGAGMAFTILAAASAGAGAAMWAAPSIVDDEATTASLALGAGFISIGLPLLMSGAPPPPDAPSIRSPAMAYAGYALFGLTAVGVTTAVAGMVASQGQGDFVALDVTVRGLTAIGFAGTLTLTGIPLVAVGSQAPAPAQPKRAVPF